MVNFRATVGSLFPRTQEGAFHCVSADTFDAAHAGPSTMAHHVQPHFYYPAPAPTNFASLNSNVVTSGGRDNNRELLHGAKTSALRLLLDRANVQREWMRTAILRYKYLHNVANAFADPHALSTQRDAFMRIVERMASNDFEPIARTESIVFSDRREDILHQQYTAHRAVHSAATLYLKTMGPLMDMLRREQQQVMRWNSISWQGNAQSGAADQTEELAPLRVRECPEPHTVEPARVHVPVMRWVSSSTLAHKSSQHIMFQASLQYDYCMGAVVAMLAAFNMAETLGQLAQHGGMFINEPDDTPAHLANRAHRAFRKARIAVRRTRDLVDRWQTRPEVTMIHAELQPFVLDALEQYAYAQCIYYREGLHTPVHTPSDYLTLPSIEKDDDTAGSREPRHLDDSVYLSKHIRTLISYNMHLCHALAHYGRQLLHRVEFSSYLHTLSSLALARIVYTETMIRTLQCANDLCDLEARSRRAMMYEVLRGSVRRIDTLENIMHYKCTSIEAWSAQVDEHTVSINMVPTYGGAVRASVIGYHLSFIDLRTLYRTCTSMWELLHQCKMHVELLMKHVS